ncbi:MAG: right-handed parallel beta-helix repeat-containing protein [Bacteroidetes bacterium]|nr:right-handed parallel beta-helix repeat-containing protein [Bacteroidota bacterium]
MKNIKGLSIVRIPVYIGYLVVFLFFFSATGFCKDIIIKSPGNHNDIQPAIQEAVDKALDGDRIILPEGQFIVNLSVQISKFISISGEGLDKTFLYRSDSIPDRTLSSKGWEAFFVFNIRRDIPSDIVVSGICFKGRKPSVVNGDGGSRASTVGIRMIGCVDFIIENCRFEYFGNTGISVRHKDTLARGLIRHNEFYFNARSGLGYGITIVGEGKQWVKDPKFGSSNFIFIEDNQFDYHRHSIASNDGALFVVRYNTILNNVAASGDHAIDMHEGRPGTDEPMGSRAMEVYNNVIVNNTYTFGGKIKKGEWYGMSSLENAGVAVRNGEALVYNNEVKGYRYAVVLSNWYLGGTPQPYPVKYGPGYLSGMEFGPGHTGDLPPKSDGDVFIWNNKISPFLDDEWNVFPSFNNEETSWWKEGRDYHLEAKPGYKAYPYPYPVKK